jgi:GNAT superfamily N-acetyltransferase
MAVNLHQLAELFRNVKRGSRTFHYVNRQDDKVYIAQNMTEASKRLVMENAKIVPITNQFDIREYGLMDIFARSLADRQTSRMLLHLLHSKSPFLKFREGVKTVGLKNEWFRFRHEIWYTAASDWCQANGITYEPKAPEIVFRAAEVDDANLVTGLFLKLYYQLPTIMRAHRADMYAKYVELLAAPDHAAFVALKDNQTVGAAHCIMDTAYEQGTAVGTFCRIQAIYVEPDYRNSYVLPVLIHLCEKWAKGHNCLRTEYADAVKLFHDSSHLACIITTKTPERKQPVTL